MNEKTLEKLNKLLELSQNDTVTPKELGNFLVMVLDVIKKSKGEFDKISNENIQVIKDSIDFIEMSHSKILSQVDEQNEKIIQETDSKLKQAQNIFDEIKAMNFKDGENGRDGAKGEKGDKGENGKDGSPDTGEEIIQKINNVAGEDDKYKIDAKHIKNLPENTKGGRGLSKVFTDETMEGDGTISNPLTVVGGGGIQSIVAGANISVDSTDPENPIVTSLSDRYKTTSTTSQAIVSTGALTFTVDANLAYTPQQDVMIVYDASNHMHGTVSSYSGTTLVVDITHKTGTGTYASWVINLDGLPVSGTTSWASITGTPTTLAGYGITNAWSTTGNAGTTYGTNYIGTSDAVELSIKTNAVQRVRVTTGLNTNKPIVQISNPTREYSPLNAMYLQLGALEYAVNSYVTIGFGYSGGGAPAYFGYQEKSSSGNTFGDLVWGTQNTGGSPTERMRLFSDGNLSLGTATNAGYKLDVNGTARVQGVVNTKNYTVATLPTGVRGDRCYVTDALAPVFLTALTGGGSIVCPAFYNGSAWVAG